MDSNPLSDVSFVNIFFPVCDLFSLFLDSVFHRAVVFNVNKVQVINYLFHRPCLWFCKGLVFYPRNNWFSLKKDGCPLCGDLLCWWLGHKTFHSSSRTLSVSLCSNHKTNFGFFIMFLVSTSFSLKWWWEKNSEQISLNLVCHLEMKWPWIHDLTLWIIFFCNLVRWYLSHVKPPSTWHEFTKPYT